MLFRVKATLPNGTLPELRATVCARGCRRNWPPSILITPTPPSSGLPSFHSLRRALTASRSRQLAKVDPPREDLRGQPPLAPTG